MIQSMITYQRILTETRGWLMALSAREREILLSQTAIQVWEWCGVLESILGGAFVILMSNRSVQQPRIYD